MHTREVESWLSGTLIRQALATHSRGVDRADATLLASAYHDGATVDYGFFVGAAQELAAILAAAQKMAPVTLHRTSNMWIQVTGEEARSESYVLAYAEDVSGGAAVQRFIGGRYLDRHEKRGGEWRIVHRRYVMDWNSNRHSTAHWPDLPLNYAHYVPRGGHGAADSGCTLLAQHAAAFHSQGAPSLSNPDRDLEIALSKDALHELSMAYARAADRADAELMASIFHEDATVVSGVFNGDAKSFAAHITGYVRENLERCFHSIANEWYEVKGDRALGECYVIASMTAGGTHSMSGGRYIDAYERRGGCWKIKARTFVLDWNQSAPSSHETGGMYAALTTRGCFGPEDPVYAFWKR